jgi:RNA polymerase sigma factor (sigma-70 family)
MEQTPEQLYLANLDLIERIAVHACRRSRLRPEDKEDFVSLVHEKLLDNNYAVIRKFERRENASFATYLDTVIRRLLLDYQNHLWGKWRNSAEAERLGEVAERLEALINRDYYTFDEACKILLNDPKLGVSEAQFDDLRAKLPPRIPRQMIGEEPLLFEPARELRPDQQLEEKEKAVKFRRINMGLSRALDSLSPEDRLLIKMTLKFKVSEIARLQKLEQKPLYRRIDKIHKALEKAMERQGVRREDVKEILDCLKKSSDEKKKSG